MSEYATVVTNVDLKPEAYSQTGDKLAQSLTLTLSKVLKNTTKVCESF